MENTTNSPETTDSEQTKSLDSLMGQAVDGENVLGGVKGRIRNTNTQEPDTSTTDGA